MTYRVKTLRKAEADVRSITNHIYKRSPQGATRWLAAYDHMVERLESHADSCGLAPEDEFFSLKIQQILFKTPRGSTYRALFTIRDSEVRVLAVRGPGQTPLTPSELQG